MSARNVKTASSAKLDSASKSSVSGSPALSPVASSQYRESRKTSRPWYKPSFRAYILVILPLLSSVGAFGTWILADKNGTFDSIFALLTSEKAQLPGTTDDLIKNYTGVESLDAQLSILVTFFAPLTGDLTPENGALHLFSIFGIGQFGAVWCLMVMESLRVGNRRWSACLVNFWSIAIVGIIFQNISYTVTTPLWLFAHILTSPVSKTHSGTNTISTLFVPAWDLYALPASIIIGFLIPTVLMGLPSPDVVAPETHQYLIAFWQIFPAWTVAVHCILRSLFKLFAVTLSGASNESKTQLHQGDLYLSNAKFVYRFVLGLCMITHIQVLLITLLPAKIFPSSLSTLALLAENNFLSVYVPYLPVPLNRQAGSFTEGVHTFLLWDLHVGSVAFLLWAVLLYRNATTERAIVGSNSSSPISKQSTRDDTENGKGKLPNLFAKIAIWTVVSGPIGALTVLLWERDMIVTQKVKQGI